MAALYSTRFTSITRAGLQGIYTVPAGFRAVVRQVDFCNFAASTNQVNIELAGIYIFLVNLAAGPSHVTWAGRQVLYHGEQLILNCQVAGVTAAASGYLFNDPAARAEPLPSD